MAQKSTIETSAADKIHASLRDRILSGDLDQGQRLVIREIATQCDSSDIPVREAIRMLQTDGLVIIYKNRGACVINLSPDDIPGAYLLRGELEALATRLAGPKLSPEDINELERMSNEMELLVLQDAREPYTQLNKKFHALIFDRCPYANIRTELDKLWSGKFNYGVLFGIDMRQLSKSSAHHRHLVELFKAGDWEGAAAVSKARKLEIARFLMFALERPVPPELFDYNEPGEQ